MMILVLKRMEAPKDKSLDLRMVLSVKGLVCLHPGISDVQSWKRRGAGTNDLWNFFYVTSYILDQ